VSRDPSLLHPGSPTAQDGVSSSLYDALCTLGPCNSTVVALLPVRLALKPSGTDCCRLVPPREEMVSKNEEPADEAELLRLRMKYKYKYKYKYSLQKQSLEDSSFAGQGWGIESVRTPPLHPICRPR